MKQLLVMDGHNYDGVTDEIYRVSVRGIIQVNGRLVMIEDSFGELKLPGGGMDPGETEEQTLIREVKEETGFDVIPESIRPFGEIVEKRLSTHEPKIWHQVNRMYFCDVRPEQGACSFTANERKYGFRQVFCTMDEAIQKNEAMLHREGMKAWNQREYRTLLLLRAYLAGEVQP